MPVELKELNDGTLLEIHLSGTLVKKDYEAFVPAVERLVKQHGTIDMLVAMHGFHGETAGAGRVYPPVAGAATLRGYVQ